MSKANFNKLSREITVEGLDHAFGVNLYLLAVSFYNNFLIILKKNKVENVLGLLS